MTKKELIFDGNEKRVYNTDDPATVVFHFKDVATAFNNVKTAVFPRKGIVNNRISAYIFDYLGKNGIYTHYIHGFTLRRDFLRDRDFLPSCCMKHPLFRGSQREPRVLMHSG